MAETIKGKLEIFQKVLDEISEIRYVGDPVLRQQAKLVDSAEGKVIGDKLGDVLSRYRDISGAGRGLAAPQIGLSKAVFVTFLDNALQVFINPTIDEKSEGTNSYREVCLSSGTMAADVERPEWIVMSWTDGEGIRHKEKVDGFLARLYQHEEAHLRGKVNLDEAREGGIEIATFDPLKENLRKLQ